MATFTFVKKGGAPAGTINIQIGNDMGCYADGLRAALNALSPRNGLAQL